MALSNWDSCMIDEKGRCLQGFWKSPLGVGVEVYKNWIHIHDEKAWEKGGSYVEPIVMLIQEGKFNYKDIEIMAIRGPQNGIFAIVYSTIYRKTVDVKYVGVICCGVSGYSGSKWVGVTKSSAKWFMKEINKKQWEETYDGRKIKDDVYDVPQIFKNINLLQGIRFNQGDLFFSKNLNVQLQSSNMGKSKEPIAQKIIKNMK